jgi:hypothetical protein
VLDLRCGTKQTSRHSDLKENNGRRCDVYGHVVPLKNRLRPSVEEVEAKCQHHIEAAQEVRIFVTHAESAQFGAM